MGHGKVRKVYEVGVGLGVLLDEDEEEEEDKGTSVGAVARTVGVEVGFDLRTCSQSDMYFIHALLYFSSSSCASAAIAAAARGSRLSYAGLLEPRVLLPALDLADVALAPSFTEPPSRLR